MTVSAHALCLCDTHAHTRTQRSARTQTRTHTHTHTHARETHTRACAQCECSTHTCTVCACSRPAHTIAHASPHHIWCARTRSHTCSAPYMWCAHTLAHTQDRTTRTVRSRASCRAPTHVHHTHGVHSSLPSLTQSHSYANSSAFHPWRVAVLQ